MRWIKALWYARLRRMDKQILWPSCRRQAYSLDAARAAFACHAFNDPAWLFLDREKIFKEIEELE